MNLRHDMPPLAIRLAIAICLTGAGTAPSLAQTSPARGPLPSAEGSADAMPMADYLGLLRQIAPAAEAGAQAYLRAFETRCKRALRTSELRRALSAGDGDPVLMGLMRASQQQDVAAIRQWQAKVSCSGSRP
ncbi:hypothetical protein P3W85_10930 [Cupriavidus basilensis]|uniref:Uncharacterized protein n=1 Tax=Cupriavidus basilensis TaxID=68895 RepID=A0ABT6AM29_9BURK|nr:hypothetical protein [Cupriavidus basilensis]MDF3833458.1 hypothetical protein [Cupriavidus basilensis]